MSEGETPFDHRPDPILGDALRVALAPRGQAEFVARVLAAAARPADPLVDVLARWARLGIAAALMAALAATLFANRADRVATELAVGGADPEAVVAGVQAPEVGVVFASYADASR
jgi:hypothetical protein